ncbi:MAG: cation:proton antiporter [Candidatus Aminicenantes bacterium]|nr:cation:proton antiporter [Candidatus Aminicenantes bacterium]MDH5743483.1 cation:proton antiporter [Candidatus Aminicenantes bacterium]
MEAGNLLFYFFIIFASAKILGEVFIRLRMPAIVGELLAGVLLGNYVLGIISTENHVLMSFAEIGVIFLLFHVGLEIRVKDLFAVGRTAVFVGLLGVIFPLILGFLTVFVIGYDFVESLFISTAILATSVGISVKVLQDMGLIKHKVAYIVLGAAVLDDILALIVLAIVKGLARQEFHAVEFSLLVVESLAFVGFLTWWGPKVAKRTRKWVEKLNIPEGPFVLSVILCLGLAELADVIGLAAIIGSFMAGIVIDEMAGVYDLENKVKYVNEFLLPFFFVMMGAHLDPRTFAQPRLLFLVLLISAVAALSKMIGAGLATWKEDWRTRIQTGICMIPRGEVGIIVALIGLSLHSITQEIYAVVLGMSLITTIITPPLIVAAFRRRRVRRQKQTNAAPE